MFTKTQFNNSILNCMEMSFERSLSFNYFKSFYNNFEYEIKSIAFFGPHDFPDNELNLVNKNVTVKSIGFEESNDIYFDIENTNLINPEQFDLVIISNVFEHVWNLNNFFDHINRIVKSGKYLYITGPLQNFYHESPNFFSAGYDPSFFEFNLKKFKFEKISEIRTGSKRLDFMQNTLKTWPSKRAYKFPILFGFNEVQFPLRLYLYLINLPMLFIACLKSPKLINDKKFLTGMAIILKKNS